MCIAARSSRTRPRSRSGWKSRSKAGGEILAMVEYYGTGRRKTSTARVHLRQGTGQITVNNRPIDEYFGNDVLKMIIKQPLSLTETSDKFDIVVVVDGGGPSGQAGAIRHGISRALQVYNAELRKRLKKAGLPTRDPRMKERKKDGQKGTRARFQFSTRWSIVRFGPRLEL